jgi:hypothetical protein
MIFDWGNLMGREHFGGAKILKWVLQKQGVGVQTGLI